MLDEADVHEEMESSEFTDEWDRDDSHARTCDRLLSRMGLDEREIRELSERLEDTRSSSGHERAFVMGVGVWVVYQMQSTILNKCEEIVESIAGASLEEVMSWTTENFEELLTAFKVLGAAASRKSTKIAEASEALAVQAGETAIEDPEAAGEALEHVDGIFDGIDVVEGASTLGLSVAASFAVDHVFSKINEEEEERLEELEEKILEIEKLERMLKEDAPPPRIAEQLSEVPSEPKQIP
jgi:hypothetical protein